MKKTELLIPVGNMETLWAAINGGADAVYLGGKKYGARAYASNFDVNEIVEAIRICHKFHVKAYVTVNTMIYNEEFSDVINYIKYLYENNVDAVILQDLGLIKYVRKNIPLLDVHVSTQAHTHNAVMTKYFYDIGCKRVVFAREMELKQIAQIDVPIEKEIFVFGALCICYSGNCLFSALNGGRSANRGMCVGSCRLPYKLYKNDKLCDDGYLLSTYDLNTISHLKEILNLGIDSLKIEGRMKSKEYVLLVSKIYRKLIDDYYAGKELVLNESLKKDLLKTYNRGFTDGYLFGAKDIINKKSSNHQGIRIGKVISVNNKKIGIKLSDDIHQGDAIRFDSYNYGMYVNCLYDDKGLLINHADSGSVCYVDNKDRVMYDHLINSNILKTVDFLLNEELAKVSTKKVPLKMKFSAHLNEPITLTIYDDSISVLVQGNEPQIANNSPVSETRVKEQLEKLGNTIYYLDNIVFDMEDNLFINIKDLNELRRNAVEKFECGTVEKNKRIVIKEPVFTKNRASDFKISVLVRTLEQFNIVLRNNIDYIYVLDKKIYDEYKDLGNVYYVLPRINNEYVELNNDKLLCTEFGSVLKYGNCNRVRTSYGLNVANDMTISLLRDLGVSSCAFSLEFDYHTNDIYNKECGEMLVFGKPLCMVIKNNIFKLDGEKCYLENTKGEKFDILSDEENTYVYNCKNIDYMDSIDKFRGVGTLRIDLLNEDAMKTQLIISKLKNKIGR